MLWQILYAIGHNFIVVNCQTSKINIAIWSHWSWLWIVTLSSIPSLFTFQLLRFRGSWTGNKNLNFRLCANFREISRKILRHKFRNLFATFCCTRCSKKILLSLSLPFPGLERINFENVEVIVFKLEKIAANWEVGNFAFCFLLLRHC